MACELGNDHARHAYGDRGDEIFECRARWVRAVHGFKKRPRGTPRTLCRSACTSKAPVNMSGDASQ